MKSAFWRATALLMALTFVLPAVALAGGQAGEVSNSAMMGSTLMNTSAQLNTWTHWATGYGNYTEINTQSLNSGSAGPQATLIWDYDDANTLLFRVRDMDLGSQSTGFMFGSMAPQLSSYTGISSYNALTNGQLINVALARELTNGAFSIGGFFADNGEKDNGSDPNEELGSSAFGAQFTWGNGNGFDVAVSVAKGSTTDNDGTNDLSDDALMFDAFGRYTRNEWIYQFGGFIGSGSDEFVGGSGIESDDFSNLGLLVNVGQMLKDDADGQVSAEFYGMYLTGKDEPQGGGEDKDTGILFPGLRSACSLKVSDHFGILLGADGYYGITGNENTIVGSENDMDFTGFNFDWSGGIFWENEDGFRVTGEFVQSNLDKAFSLGNDEPLVSRLEATFGF
jgi:hypothetical protein